MLIEEILAELLLIQFFKTQVGILKCKNLETKRLFHSQVGGVNIFLSQNVIMFCSCLSKQLDLSVCPFIANRKIILSKMSQ